MPRVDNEVRFTPAQYPGLCRDCPGGPHASYSERLLVGYRWYLAHPAVVPAFAFGFGLSYSSFGYSALVVRADRGAATAVVTNTGRRAGAEVAQLYLAFPAAAGEPVLQLRGFEKVFLAPGAAAAVAFPLGPRALSVWDPASHRWAEVRGEFGAAVGASVADIRLRLQFDN
jgi:beta-glucosidase